MMKVICSKHWEISPTNHPHLISPSFQQASLQYWPWIIILYLLWIHQTDPTSCKTTINKSQFASYLSIQELHPKRYIGRNVWIKIGCEPNPFPVHLIYGFCAFLSFYPFPVILLILLTRGVVGVSGWAGVAGTRNAYPPCNDPSIIFSSFFLSFLLFLSTLPRAVLGRVFKCAL